MKLKNRKNQKGFSLVELMIVVVIIGLLASVGIPQYQKFTMKAKQSEVKSLLSAMYTAQKAFHSEWNRYYTDFNAVGFGHEGDLGYVVGFTRNFAGPVTHPNTAYRNRNGAVIHSRTFCTVATNNCSITKARVTERNLAATTMTAGAFSFSGSANIDGDGTIDQWRINQRKQFTQLSDDVSR